MQWGIAETVVVVILAIGIYTAIMEAQAKRAARKKWSKKAEAEPQSAK